jgi:hypothetical protein
MQTGCQLVSGHMAGSDPSAWQCTPAAPAAAAAGSHHIATASSDKPLPLPQDAGCCAAMAFCLETWLMSDRDRIGLVGLMPLMQLWHTHEAC